MKQTRAKLAHAVADRSLKKGPGKKLAKEVAAYLLAENRVGELDSLLRDVQADWAEAGYVEVLAHSAHPLSAAVQAKIKRQARQLYPNAKQVVVTEVYDPEVIGGVRLRTADRQLDLSVEAKLNRFKQLTTTQGQGKD